MIIGVFDAGVAWTIDIYIFIDRHTYHELRLYFQYLIKELLLLDTECGDYTDIRLRILID